MNAGYYAQRAGAGLIISEATQITQQGKGYAWTPGIETAAQVTGWRLVTDAVHANGGRIFLQLWHVGTIIGLTPQATNASICSIGEVSWMFSRLPISATTMRLVNS